MTKRLIIALTAVLALMCSACQNNTGMTPKGSSGQTGPTLVISGSTTPSSRNHITTAGIPPTTEMKGSDAAPSPGSSGLTALGKSHDTETTEPASLVVPDKPTQAPKTDSTKEVATSGTTITSTTGKPQTTSTSRPTTSAATTTTTAATKSPWTYPYDVSEIIRECKAEITRVGLVWHDSLVGLSGRNGKPIGLPDGVSETDPSIDWAGWDNSYSTGVFTDYPDEYSLKFYIFNEMIPFYMKNQKRYSLKRCKIWFEPLPDYLGDYNIYFLYATS